jgi:protease-4
LTVEDIWSMLRRAASDSRIKAVVFEPEDSSVGWAKMQEIRADLEQFRKSGKPLVAYLKSPGTRDYYMATACSKIYMAPEDLLDLKGVALGTMYFKNSAGQARRPGGRRARGEIQRLRGHVHPKTTMSPETREVMTSMVDDIYGDLVGTIAKGRGKDAVSVRNIVDNGPFLSTQAKLVNGLVDELRFEDQVFGELKAQLASGRAEEDQRPGLPRRSRTRTQGCDGKDKIAWVVGDGSITRGSADSNNTTGIESESFDKMLGRVASDAKREGRDCAHRFAGRRGDGLGRYLAGDE